MGNQLNTQKALLDAIAAELQLRALSGLHTSIIKVNTHKGIVGNEVADNLQVVSIEARDAAACQLTYVMGSQAHQGKHWLVLSRRMAPDHLNREQVAGHLHADMKALYIERHNAAGRRIAQELCNGAHGNHIMVGDMGYAEKRQGLLFPLYQDSKWLLSDQDCDTVDSDRFMLRPDLMVINIQTKPQPH